MQRQRQLPSPGVTSASKLAGPVIFPLDMSCDQKNKKNEGKLAGLLSTGTDMRFRSRLKVSSLLRLEGMPFYQKSKVEFSQKNELCPCSIFLGKTKIIPNVKGWKQSSGIFSNICYFYENSHETCHMTRRKTIVSLKCLGR